MTNPWQFGLDAELKLSDEAFASGHRRALKIIAVIREVHAHMKGAYPDDDVKDLAIALTQLSASYCAHGPGGKTVAEFFADHMLMATEAARAVARSACPCPNCVASFLAARVDRNQASQKAHHGTRTEDRRPAEGHQEQTYSCEAENP